MTHVEFISLNRQSSTLAVFPPDGPDEIASTSSGRALGKGGLSVTVETLEPNAWKATVPD